MQRLEDLEDMLEVDVAVQTETEASQAELMDYAETQLRELCGSRKLDWDAMTEADRENFVNDLIHEECQLRHVVKDFGFSDKVFFVADIQECDDAIPTEWQSIVSCFRTEVESERKRFREEWEKTVVHFHNAFADIPEAEVLRHFEEALAEVRRE